MPKNMYDGVDPDAVSFIDRKAKDLTHSSFFTSADFKDLQQELTLAFLHAWPKFDPSKGDRLSFIKAVVNNCARNLKIIAKAKKRWIGQGLLSLSEVVLEGEESLTLADTVANEEGLWGDASLEFHQLSSEIRHDVERVIATVTFQSQCQQIVKADVNGNFVG